MAYSNVTPPTLPDYSPVSGYSYNGVELPDIESVWSDEVKAEKPYAVIHLWTDGGYRAKISNVRPYYDGTYLQIKSTDGSAAYVLYYKYDVETGTWVSDGSFGNGVSIGFNLAAGNVIVWSNVDILNSNGTTFLAASDPVPIEPYPYSVIAYNYEKGAEDWYQAHLYYSATAFTWNGTAVVNSGTTYKRIYDAELDAWTDEAETEIEATPGLDGTVYQRIYTDHDILDSTGAVWLAAGEVTPVEDTGVSEEWLYSFKLGLALGLCGKPLPIAEKTPVAGLYETGTANLIYSWEQLLGDEILEGGVVHVDEDGYVKTNCDIDTLENPSISVLVGDLVLPTDGTITKIASSAFWRCTGLTKIDLPTLAAHSFGTSAFQGCTGLTSVRIPAQVTSTGPSSFRECTGLISVDISNSVAYIDVNTFYGCTNLAKIFIPSSVIYIDMYAFADCTSLAEITFGGTVEEWKAVSLRADWNKNILASEVICSDGIVSL